MLRDLQREMRTRLHDGTAALNHLRQDVDDQRKTLATEEQEMEALEVFIGNKEATIAESRYLSPLSEGTKIDDLPASIALVEGRVT